MDAEHQFFILNFKKEDAVFANTVQLKNEAARLHQLVLALN